MYSTCTQVKARTLYYCYLVVIHLLQSHDDIICTPYILIIIISQYKSIQSIPSLHVHCIVHVIPYHGKDQTQSEDTVQHYQHNNHQLLPKQNQYKNQIQSHIVYMSYTISYIVYDLISYIVYMQAPSSPFLSLSLLILFTRTNSH